MQGFREVELAYAGWQNLQEKIETNPKSVIVIDYLKGNYMAHFPSRGN